jgi:hypothetical protein
MKISELVAKLEEQKKLHGDVDVWMDWGADAALVETFDAKHFPDDNCVLVSLFDLLD